MPRLTFCDYCTRRTILTALYDQHDSAFIRLTTAEQRTLHDYYAPALELEPAELTAHRRAITKRDPSLPQRAGRAWAHLERLHIERPMPAAVVVPSGRRRRPRHIHARGVLRPEPDYDKLVRTMLHIVDEQVGDKPAA